MEEHRVLSRRLVDGLPFFAAGEGPPKGCNVVCVGDDTLRVASAEGEQPVNAWGDHATCSNLSRYGRSWEL